jgi:hypothetical protein
MAVGRRYRFTAGEGAMQETRYGLKVTIPVGYDEAVTRTTDALKAEGFCKLRLTILG